MTWLVGQFANAGNTESAGFMVSWDSGYYYWDYQTMRNNYGAEMGASRPVGLPAAPHPWCTQSGSDILPLVEYVLTLWC